MGLSCAPSLTASAKSVGGQARIESGPRVISFAIDEEYLHRRLGNLRDLLMEARKRSLDVHWG
jgi:hypothetical protein